MRCDVSVLILSSYSGGAFPGWRAEAYGVAESSLFQPRRSIVAEDTYLSGTASTVCCAALVVGVLACVLCLSITLRLFDSGVQCVTCSSRLSPLGYKLDP